MSRKQNIAKRKTGCHHGDLGTALIECGLELIEEKGIRALTMREIGARLGVSRSAAYRHFRDKADLLSAISRAGFLELAGALETAKKGAEGGFKSQMDVMAEAYVRFALEHRARFEVMFSALLEGGGTTEGSGQAFRVLEDVIREAQQDGEVRPGDPALLARVVWALVHGASILLSDEVLMSGEARMR
jgi:AcrR family transcriptional regulator